MSHLISFLVFRITMTHAHMLKMDVGISITLLQDYQEDFAKYLWDQYSLSMYWWGGKNTSMQHFLWNVHPCCLLQLRNELTIIKITIIIIKAASSNKWALALRTSEGTRHDVCSTATCMSCCSVWCKSCKSSDACQTSSVQWVVLRMWHREAGKLYAQAIMASSFMAKHRNGSQHHAHQVRWRRNLLIMFHLQGLRMILSVKSVVVCRSL